MVTKQQASLLNISNQVFKILGEKFTRFTIDLTYSTLDIWLDHEVTELNWYYFDPLFQYFIEKGIKYKITNEDTGVNRHFKINIWK